MNNRLQQRQKSYHYLEIIIHVSVGMYLSVWVNGTEYKAKFGNNNNQASFQNSLMDNLQ